MRRRCNRTSDEEELVARILTDQRLAKAIAGELLALIYNQVGRTMVKQFLWLLVSVILALGIYFGIIKIP